MERVLIDQLHNFIDKEITVSGWVDVRRDHGKIIFIDLRDRSGLVQCVFSPDSQKALDDAISLRPEWVIQITGNVQKRPNSMVNSENPMGDVEVGVSNIEVLSEASELPFEKGTDLNLDTYLNFLPLALRDKKRRQTFSVQATIIDSFRKTLNNLDFKEFQAPKLVGTDAEGGAQTFNVDYFGATAHLATSPQFYKQIMVGVFERVYTTGNAYRAEKHATSRHLSEYTSLDFELGFIKDHVDVMNVQTEIMREMVVTIEEKHSKILADFGVELPLIPDEIPVMKLRDAQKLLKSEFGENCLEEPDLEPLHERQLCEYAKKEFKSDFIYITHYPVKKRPMYTFEDEEDMGYTKSFDLLFRGVEITTGGQRINNYDLLVSNIEKWGLNPDDFAYYLQSFKFGMPPEGGAASGLERLTAKILGLANVKEATLFPRDINRIDTLIRE